MRVCNKCKMEKSLDLFHKCKKFPLGVVYTCKVCAKERSVSWNKKNKERKRKQGKDHYLANKEVYIERAKKSKWRDKNRDRVKELTRVRYRLNNGSSIVAHYRHIRKRAQPDWLSDDQKKEIKNFYWLAKDLKAVTGESYQVDHIVPINGKDVCGLHVPWNLQILPSDLNQSKGNKF